MSKSTFGWRQAGFTAVATALVFGGTLVGAGAANAAVATLTAASTPSVSQNQNPATAGSLTYSFDNTVGTTPTTVAFSIAGNDCSTVAGIAESIVFASAPTVTAVTPATGVVAVSPAVLSSTGGCTNNVATVTLTGTSAGDPTDRLAFTLNAVAYDVGPDAPLGNVTVNATSTLGNASAVNAVVAGTTLSIASATAATPGAQNVALGTATISESAPGVEFTASSAVTVNLALDGVTVVDDGSGLPTVTVTGGRTITNRNFGVAATDDGFNFTVNTPAVVAPAVLQAATVTVAGLRADTDNGAVPAVEQIDLTTNLDTIPTEVKALNVVDYSNANRLGGDDRYETAAKLYQAGPGGTITAPATAVPTVAVLSGGELFPDALSANYLAKALGTGTLLTTAKTLSSDARNVIIDNFVETVYITGETGAVSQAIEDQLESTHVGGYPFAPFIKTVRLGGDDRYDTNQRVNNFAEGLTSTGSTSTVLLSSGENFPDALAFGPIAYAREFPLVLTQGSLLSDQASAQLAAFDPTNVVISGEIGAVSAGVASDVSDTGATVSRLGGNDRSQTATKIATWATEGLPDSEAPAGILRDDQGFDSATVNMTWTGTAQGFGDALAAGPLAGSTASVILLANSTTTPGTYVDAYLGLKEVGDTADGTFVGLLRALGGTGVTSTSLMKAAAVSIQK